MVFTATTTTTFFGKPSLNLVCEIPEDSTDVPKHEGVL